MGEQTDTARIMIKSGLASPHPPPQKNPQSTGAEGSAQTIISRFLQRSNKYEDFYIVLLHMEFSR